MIEDFIYASVDRENLKVVLWQISDWKLEINQCKCVHNYTIVLFNCELIFRMQDFTYSGIAGDSSLRECDAVSSCTYLPTSLLVQGGV